MELKKKKLRGNCSIIEFYFLHLLFLQFMFGNELCQPVIQVSLSVSENIEVSFCQLFESKQFCCLKYMLNQLMIFFSIQ